MQTFNDIKGIFARIDILFQLVNQKIMEQKVFLTKIDEILNSNEINAFNCCATNIRLYNLGYITKDELIKRIGI